MPLLPSHYPLPEDGSQRWANLSLLQDDLIVDLFYKNDLPEKFGVGLDESFFIDSPEAEEEFTTCSQMSINEYRKQPTDAARQEFVAKIQVHNAVRG